MHIPLTKPFWGKREERATVEAIRSFHGSGDGLFTAKLIRKLSDLTGSRYVLPVTSGTHGLELAMIALGVKPGDEVIMPSYTMSSTANCVVLQGGKPVFADIENRTFGIDPTDVQQCITKRTKGIIVVHYAGMPSSIESIIAIAKKHHLFVVEDAAHAIGAYYKGKALGTFGDIGVYSFHGTKNIASGEGGFFVTNDPKIASVAEVIREKGTDRSAYVRGERKRYSWIRVGRSLVLSDILAAIALEQIKKLDEITNLRRKNAIYLLTKLKKLATKIILPFEPENAFANWHIFAIRIPRLSRDKVIKGLRSFGIEASFHYLPLHASAMGKKLGYKVGDLPVTEEVAATLIRLPMYPKLKKSELNYMAAVLEKIM